MITSEKLTPIRPSVTFKSVANPDGHGPSLVLCASLEQATYDHEWLEAYAISDDLTERAHVIAEMRHLVRDASNGQYSVRADQHSDASFFPWRPDPLPGASFLTQGRASCRSYCGGSRSANFLRIRPDVVGSLHFQSFNCG